MVRPDFAVALQDSQPGSIGFPKSLYRTYGFRFVFRQGELSTAGVQATPFRIFIAGTSMSAIVRRLCATL